MWIPKTWHKEGLEIAGYSVPSQYTSPIDSTCFTSREYGVQALAEYDGAIAKLFRKSAPDLSTLPAYDKFNTYTVTLHDLTHSPGPHERFNEMDVVIDERLCLRPDGDGLLGATPSPMAETWVCYLEKAVAAHCGGWDKIQGGQCTHAWRLLLGAREVYTIKIDGSGYGAFGTLNPQTGKREQLGNSPHDGFQGEWPMAWPTVRPGTERRH